MNRSRKEYIIIIISRFASQRVLIDSEQKGHVFYRQRSHVQFWITLNDNLADNGQAGKLFFSFRCMTFQFRNLSTNDSGLSIKKYILLSKFD